MLKNDNYWKDKLSPDHYSICREKGTERAFTGEYWNTTTEGDYRCRCCGEKLFESSAKFDAGCGWPSFFVPMGEQVVSEHVDSSHGMLRTEVVCSRCDCHLGHVFTDGPEPTGLRYCINSASIVLDEDG